MQGNPTASTSSSPPENLDAEREGQPGLLPTLTTSPPSITVSRSLLPSRLCPNVIQSGPYAPATNARRQANPAAHPARTRTQDHLTSTSASQAAGPSRTQDNPRASTSSSQATGSLRRTPPPPSGRRRTCSPSNQTMPAGSLEQVTLRPFVIQADADEPSQVSIHIHH
jgi:hypothetical protein